MFNMLHRLRPIATVGILAVAVIGLMLWLTGYFHDKIKSDAGGRKSAVTRPIADAELAQVRTIRLPRTETAVGTIGAVHETAVASKILAKVIEVNVIAGKAVQQGDVLVRLDDRELKARQEQAAAALRAAMAGRDQAKIEFDRTNDLFQRNNASKTELDRMTAALQGAEAEVDRAQRALQEAETVVSHAVINSPLTGVVIDKQVEAGDIVAPGQTLLRLYDPTRMQLVANVREALTQRLAVGQSIGVRVDALDKACEGRISEIVPQAAAASRTFTVKVTGPCPPGIYSGMFGRLLIPLDEEEVLVAPRAALRRVGQLDMVDVAVDGVLRRRVVQPGREIGEDVEILSGLRTGERLALPNAAVAPK